MLSCCHVVVFAICLAVGPAVVSYITKATVLFCAVWRGWLAGCDNGANALYQRVLVSNKQQTMEPLSLAPCRAPTPPWYAWCCGPSHAHAKLNEKVDLETLDALVANTHGAVVVCPEERVKFIHFADRITQANGEMAVAYSQSPHSKGYGRVYAEGALSLQSFSKPVRGALGHKLYVEVDMCNAHPTVLDQVCEFHGLQHGNIHSYVLTRDERLKSVCARCDCTRGDAKNLFLSLIYGGTIEQWKTRRHLFGTPVPAFVKDFATEVEKCAYTLGVLYSHVPESGRAVVPPAFSRLSLLLQHIEHFLLERAVAWFMMEGPEPAVLIFDGFLVHKPVSADCLVQCAAHVKQETGLAVKFEAKELHLAQ